VLSLHGAARQSPKLPRLAAEPGSRFPAGGFSAHRCRDPTRLPRTQSTVGDQPPRLDRWPTIRRHINRGPASVFRPPRAVAPFREENDDRPRSGPFAFLSLGDALLVEPRGLPWTHHRDASNPLLQPTFRVTSTRNKNILFGDFPPSAVGYPAGVRLRDPPRTWRRRPFVEDAGPPRGHPASDSPVLDGTLPASGREAAAPRFRAARGERGSFFRLPSRFAGRTL
jgi:hypothetical protein